MMISGPEKQAPEDRQATEDVDVMTQYEVEEPGRSFLSVSEGTSKGAGTA